MITKHAPDPLHKRETLCGESLVRVGNPLHIVASVGDSINCPNCRIDFGLPPFDPVKPPPTYPTCVGKPHEFHPFDFVCVHCGAHLNEETVDADCPRLSSQSTSHNHGVKS